MEPKPITNPAANNATMGAMTMIVTLAARDDGTDAAIAFERLPPGISPADNDAGTRSSLEKLATYVKGRR